MGSPKGFRTSFLSFQSGTSLQPDSQRRKRKSYFQYFSFDFFSMAVIKPGLLLKQYHLKSPNLPDHGMRRKTETIVEGCPVYCYTLGGRLIHGGVWLGNHEEVLSGLSCGFERVGAPGNSNPLATISMTGGVRPFRLGTKPLGPNDDSREELVKAPSEDELLEECPEAELGDPDREEVLELEEATSTFGLD
ncbi:hypothetical protein Cgig2_002994 [Carnegiea gigantea]|uniref:Uncharacterized protein n=1 Tax=Carnegiea gigantea TaxID=171969 RepID=A0A9Q1K7L6_9CARY|nr:hypothetical protein Cgig2_002994 [Carnegiea gigantea]